MPDPTPDPSLLSADEQRKRRYLLIVGVVALLLAVWGIVSRLSARNTLQREAASAAVPTVITVHATSGAPADTLVLPGNVQAYYEAPIYARTSGYLKAWYTDIGTRVKKGELLAEIETPEVDQQLRQAQADLGTAQANYELSRTTNERWKGLLATQSVSQQDADERAGDAAAKAAARASASANLARLRELESFKRVLAPFAGVVTQRNTDVGALINAGESPGSALFRVADTHRLRIYVFVPQPYSAEVRPGLDATLVLTDHPGERYTATVASTAQALDATSRTLQVELQIDNSAAELLPGSYAQVTFSLPSRVSTLRVPVNAVMFRGQNVQVATVDDRHTVRLKNITEGRDFGTEIEVLAGITPEDVLILNPSDSIADGQQVRVQEPSAPQSQRPPAAAEHSP
jgi:RND family efflux transporter MFP subunit